MLATRLISLSLLIPLCFLPETAWAAPDLKEILRNLARTIGPLQQMVTGFAYVMGMAFIFRGLYKLKIYGDLRTMMSSQASLGEPITYLVVAAVFIFIPTAMDIMMQSTFGYTSPLAYGEWSATANGQYGDALRVALMVVQLFGVIAFVRGWMLIGRQAQHGMQSGMGKGIAHIIGGLFAINIVGTATIIQNTLGL